MAKDVNLKEGLQATNLVRSKINLDQSAEMSQKHGKKASPKKLIVKKKSIERQVGATASLVVAT